MPARRDRCRGWGILGSRWCESCFVSEFRFVGEFPDTELSRRLRANRGRRLRPDFDTRVEEALGYRPSDDDFVDIPSTDKLLAQLRTRSTETVERIWPESEWLSLRARLYELAARLGNEHSSYLAFFEEWQCLGALRVRSAVLLRGAEGFWKPAWEALPWSPTRAETDSGWTTSTPTIRRARPSTSTSSAAGANSTLPATPSGEPATQVLRPSIPE